MPSDNTIELRDSTYPWIYMYNSTIYSFIRAVIHIIGNGYEHTGYLCMYISEDNNKRSEKDGFRNKGAS